MRWRRNIQRAALTLAAFMLVCSIPVPAAMANAVLPSEVVASTPAVITADTAAIAREASASVRPPLAVPTASDEVLLQDSLDSSFTKNRDQPINRWWISGATFHDKFGDQVWDQAIEKIQRGTMQTTGMLIGNTVWYAIGEFSRFAMTFDIMDAGGAQIDQFAGRIGQAIITTPAIIGGIALGIIAVVVMPGIKNVRRGGKFAWGRLIGASMVLALISGMSVAALGSETVDGKYVPKAGSPGWVATTLSDGVGNIAAAPAAQLANWGEGSGAAASPKNFDLRWSCDAYVQVGLRQRLAEKTSKDGLTVDTNIVGITNVVNDLWTTTGLKAWKVSQVGTGNPYGDHMWCRVLEDITPGMTGAVAQNVTKRADGLRVGSGTGHLPGAAPDGGRALKTYNKNDRDKSMVAWAACVDKAPIGSSRVNWQVREEFTKDKDDKQWIAKADCDAWWQAATGEDIPAAFEVGGSPEEVSEKTSDARIQNFLNSLHGRDTFAGLGSTNVYVLSSFAMGLVFILLSLAVILSRLYVLILMVTFFFVAIAAIFSKNSMSEKLMGTVKKLLGATIFSSGAILILSMVALFTKILIGVGDDTFGAGTIPAQLFAGAAPIAAVFMLSKVFTDILKLPTPFSPTGAMAWGAAAGGVGGAVAGGVMGRAAARAQNAPKALGDKALNKVSGGRLGNAGTGLLNSSGEVKGGMDGGQRAVATTDEVEKSSMTPKEIKREEKKEAKLEVKAANAHRWEKDGLPANSLARAWETKGKPLTSFVGKELPATARGAAALATAGALGVANLSKAGAAGLGALHEEGLAGLGERAKAVGVRASETASEKWAAIRGATNAEARKQVGERMKGNLTAGTDRIKEHYLGKATAEGLDPSLALGPTTPWNTLRRHAESVTHTVGSDAAKLTKMASKATVTTAKAAVNGAAQFPTAAAGALGGHGAGVASDVRKMAPVAGMAALAVANPVVGAAVAGGYLVSKGKQARRVHKAQKAHIVNEYRADKQAALDAAKTAEQDQQKAQRDAEKAQQKAERKAEQKAASAEAPTTGPDKASSMKPDDITL